MPRPKTKKELTNLSHENFNLLLEQIEALPKDQQTAEFPKKYLNRNISDILMHLHEWHLMMLDWYKVGMKGDQPDMPAPGYTWKTLPKLNQEIQKKHAGTSLSNAKKKLRKSFADVQKVIKKHTDKELFEKKRYDWTGSTSLGSYLISATSSHYDWAMKLIKKALK